MLRWFSGRVFDVALSLSELVPVGSFVWRKLRSLGLSAASVVCGEDEHRWEFAVAQFDSRYDALIAEQNADIDAYHSSLCGTCGASPCYHLCPNSQHFYSPEQERLDDAHYGDDDVRERFAGEVIVDDFDEDELFAEALAATARLGADRLIPNVPETSARHAEMARIRQAEATQRMIDEAFEAAALNADTINARSFGISVDEYRERRRLALDNDLPF